MLIYPLKVIVAAIAVILSFVGYIPYIHDTLKGKTKPHIYSWFIWGFASLLVFFLQYGDNAGPGAFVTLAAACGCLAIFAISYRKGNRDITAADTAFFAISLAALVLWLFAGQAIISVILLCSVDLFGFMPTIRKSWSKPYTETLFTYGTSTLRFALAIYALQTYTIVTSLYPVAWLLANGSFAVLLVVRRRQLGKRS